MGKTSMPDASRGTLFLVDPDNLTIIGVDTDDGPGHELYQEGLDAPLDQAMVESVIEHGVLQDVGVRKNGSFMEVVRGRHRVLWTRAANARLAAVGKDPRLVPCVVVRIDPKTAAVQMVVENEHHKQPPSALVRARHAERMLTAGHKTQDVARAFNVSVQAINQWRKLLDLAAPVLKMLETGQLSASAAGTLSTLEHKEQVVKAKELVEAGGGVVEAQRVVRAARTASAPKADGDAPKADTTVAPSKVVLRKVVAHEGFAELDAGVQAAIKWAAGEGAPTRIGGLTAILNALSLNSGVS